MEILTRIKHPWVVAVGSLVAYAAGFPALYPVIGDVYGSLSFIPVALAAHLYGRIGGYGFVVLTSVLNGALFSAAALESGNEAAVWEAIVPVLVLLATAEFVAQLRSANRALRESNRSKDYFLASVSHELRTPLTGVVGFADTLTAAWEDMSDEDKLALMSDIDSQAKEMASIIDDLLVASRAELDQLTVLRQPVDVSAEIQAVLASLPGVQDRTVLFIEKDGVMAVGDAARVRQIVRNLTTNALRYGGSTIWLGADTVDTTVQIRVADTGKGIPPDQWERIFDRYHRLDSDRSNPGGVGVGLSVSRLLARLMGGDVTYEYRNGMSLFEVTLPALTGALGTEWETSSVPSQA